ncbi:MULTISPECIES: hypothetical protein [Stenotrophomonas]|uniref:hypothetical protein n=1 Tax=Stenotrophomonas TaxID=40323 RepID=UPI0021C58480|nr:MULTISPECIES: hypothetical protein [Stenotrophomonas]MCU1136828.1 hypothetical protein [Stenotrophomonas maltophilia]MEC4339845.1 hypothetical protein [Stenotrophomonas pavanii]
MTANTGSRFQTASTAEALAIAFEHNPSNANLGTILGDVTPLLAAAFGLANGISRSAPDLVHKPSLHVLVVAPEELVVDQGRWLQLAADLLEREHPINISIARTDGPQLPSSAHAELIAHQSPGSIVERDACILLNTPDVIYAPFMRMPASETDLPGLSWVGKAMSKGIRVTGSACNPLEASVLAACITGGSLGEVRRLGANHGFDAGVDLEILPPPHAAAMDPTLARLAIKWFADILNAERSGRDALLAFIREPAAGEAMSRMAAATGEFGELLAGNWAAIAANVRPETAR